MEKADFQEFRHEIFDLDLDGPKFQGVPDPENNLYTNSPVPGHLELYSCSTHTVLFVLF